MLSSLLFLLPPLLLLNTGHVAMCMALGSDEARLSASSNHVGLACVPGQPLQSPRTSCARWEGGMCQAGPGRGPGIGRALGLLAKGGRHSAGLCAAPHRGSVRNTPRLLVGSLCGAAVLGELWAGGGCTVSRRPSSLGLVPAPVTGRGHLSSWAFQLDKWQCFPCCASSVQTLLPLEPRSRSRKEMATGDGDGAGTRLFQMETWLAGVPAPRA